MRIDTALEALSAVKNLTLDELTALLEVVDEKVKSSMDLSDHEKETFFFDFISDIILDCKYYQQQREDAIALHAENEVLDRKFGFVRGDTTHD